MKIVDVSALRSFRWIFPTSSHFLRRKIEQLFESGGYPVPSPVAEIASISIIKSVIQQSHYITLVGRSSIENEIQAGTLVSINLDLPIMSRPIGMIWRKNHGVGAAASIVMKTLANIAHHASEFAMPA